MKNKHLLLVWEEVSLEYLQKSANIYEVFFSFASLV